MYMYRYVLNICIQMCLDIPDSDKPEFTINQTIFGRRKAAR